MSTTPTATMLRELKKSFAKVIPLYGLPCFLVTDHFEKKKLVYPDGSEPDEAYKNEIRDKWMMVGDSVVVSNADEIRICTETGNKILLPGKKFVW